MFYSRKGRGIGFFADNAVYVAKTDTTASTFEPGAVWVGQGGTVVLECADSVSSGTVQFAGVQSGSVIPVLAKRIHSTGTTATSFVILY